MLLFFKASATASAPPTTSLPRTRLNCERRSRSRKNGGGLDDCVAQTFDAEVELGGSVVSLQLLGELLRRQGAGAEETKRSLGDFLQRGFSLMIFGDVLLFMENEANMNWNLFWINHCEYKNNHIMKFISGQANHHRTSTRWDFQIFVAIDTPACWFPYPSSIVECLSLIRTFPGNTSARWGWSCCSSAFVASNKQKNTSGCSAT